MPQSNESLNSENINKETTVISNSSKVKSSFILLPETKMEMNQNVTKKELLERIEENEEHIRNPICWTKIIWAFTSFCISLADVTVVIYLSYLHFSERSDIIAWMMLLPILLNFIGIFTFLSDDEERREMETLGCQNLIWKNLMFFPILGPSVSSLKLFYLSFQKKHAERFARFESLVIRMKQYESFFQAAPEAFVQITMRILTWSWGKEIHAEDYWIKACITLSIFALAESNMYSTIIPYYKMFTRIRTKDAWNIEHISIPWRVALFFFNFMSIESRLHADAILKSTACFYFHKYSFGQVLIVTFICQFTFRAVIHIIFVSILGSKRQKKILLDTGVYGAFTYAWRSLFMSFDFQSYCIPVFLSFYLENFILIVASYAVILTATKVNLREKYAFNIYAGISLLCMVLAIGLRCLIRKRFEITKLIKKSDNKVSPIKYF